MDHNNTGIIDLYQYYDFHISKQECCQISIYPLGKYANMTDLGHFLQKKIIRKSSKLLSLTFQDLSHKYIPSLICDGNYVSIGYAKLN